MKKIKFEELKMGHISLLTRAKSPLVEGTKNESDVLESVVDYIYATNALKQASVSAKKGTFYEDAIEFANEFSEAQVVEFYEKHLKPEMQEVDEAKVEVIPDKKDAPKKKAQK